MSRRHIGDLIQITKFHEEIKDEPIYRSDILDTRIIVYDISEQIIRKKSEVVKYDSTNIIILMSYLNDKTNKKYLCWVSGDVVISQLEKLRSEFPDLEGIEMTLTKPENYYRFE